MPVISAAQLARGGAGLKCVLSFNYRPTFGEERLVFANAGANVETGVENGIAASAAYSKGKAALWQLGEARGRLNGGGMRGVYALAAGMIQSHTTGKCRDRSASAVPDVFLCAKIDGQMVELDRYLEDEHGKTYGIGAGTPVATLNSRPDH